MNITILIYIGIGVCAFALAQYLINIASVRYKAEYEERKKKAEAKRLEQLKWKYAKVTPDNFLLNSIINHHEIIMSGEPGKGKTIMMNLIAHFIVIKSEQEFNQLKRYYRIMRPDYYRERLWLIKQRLLPIYSELELKDHNGAHNQDFWPYFLLQRKAIYKAVFCKDEFGEDFGKDFFFQQQGVKDVVDEITKLFRKIRHYLNGWIVGTEQDKDNIFIGFRRIGYAKVTALGTVVQLSPIGKFKRSLLNLCNLILPGFMTINYSRAYRFVFKRDKVLTFFKSLLPSYFFLPKEYYTRKKEIDDKVKYKHQRFTVRSQFDTGEYFIRFTHQDIYIYDTRAYKDEYSAMFDKHGNRKEVMG